MSQVQHIFDWKPGASGSVGNDTVRYKSADDLEEMFPDDLSRIAIDL